MRPDGRISVYPPGGSAVKEQSGPRKSAVGQVLEIGNQLPGRRGPRRVDGAHIGPTHAPGAGRNRSVTVPKRVQPAPTEWSEQTREPNDRRHDKPVPHFGNRHVDF
jgi:hypothetical protein